jgi:hypothetical protein
MNEVIIKKEIEIERHIIHENITYVKIDKSNTLLNKTIELSKKAKDLTSKTVEITKDKINKQTYHDNIHRVRYESLYEKEYMANSFLKFLSTESNTAPFEFILKLKILEKPLKELIFNKTIKVDEKIGILEKLLELIEEYVIKVSINQININAKDNENIRNLFDLIKKFINKELEEEFDFKLLYDVLNNIQKKLRAELYSDSVNFFFNIIKK